MRNDIFSLAGRYAAPVGSILGGLVLLFSPDTATVLIATVVGWAALVIGILLTVVAVAGRQGLGAIFSGIAGIAVGLWLTRSPMSLAVAFGKILGLGLLFGAVSGYRRSNTGAGRTIYLAEGLFGLVLLIAPLTASRAVYTVIGLALIAAGVVMLLNRTGRGPRIGGGRGNIIDI